MYEKLDELSFKELLGYSIEGEQAAYDAYMSLAERMSGLVEDRFKSLAEDEMMHKKELLKLHEKEFGDKEYVVPDEEGLPPHEGAFIKLKTVQNLIDAIEQSMAAEENAYELYSQLAKRKPKFKTLFDYIAIMEKGHYSSLKAEKKLYENRYEKDREKHIPGFQELTMGTQG